jgi:hypothetical protein
MDSVTNFSFHHNQLFSVPDKGSKITIDPGLGRATVRPSVEQHGGNAHQVQTICAGLEILPLFFGIAGIYMSNQPSIRAQSAGKILCI